MFSFFKKRSQELAPGLAGLACDMHSHLIPGIDDGSRDLEMSLRLIRGLMELGYRRIITTPHINQDIYPNNSSNIGEGRVVVADELRRQGLSIEFRAAAEYILDDHFMRALETGEPFLTLKDNLILVELSFVLPSINLKEILFELQLKGYQPVLAHPERYLYFGANKGWYDQLKDAGCLFQLNLLSLRGHYGRDSQRLAEYLIRKKYVDLLGTDLHHEKHLELLNDQKIFNTVARLLDTGAIRNAAL